MIKFGGNLVIFLTDISHKYDLMARMSGCARYIFVQGAKLSTMTIVSNQMVENHLGMN